MKGGIKRRENAGRDFFSSDPLIYAMTTELMPPSTETQ
jgi:hypothetical protein